jgi:hypothetical protein
MAAEVIRLAVWTFDEILTRNALEFRDLVERLERVQSRAEQLHEKRSTHSGTAPRSDQAGIFDAYEMQAGEMREAIEPDVNVEAPPLVYPKPPRNQFVRGRGRRRIAFDRITGNPAADLELARAAGKVRRPLWWRLRRWLK